MAKLSSYACSINLEWGRGNLVVNYIHAVVVTFKALTAMTVVVVVFVVVVVVIPVVHVVISVAVVVVVVVFDVLFVIFCCYGRCRCCIRYCVYVHCLITDLTAMTFEISLMSSSLG